MTDHKRESGTDRHVDFIRTIYIGLPEQDLQTGQQDETAAESEEESEAEMTAQLDELMRQLFEEDDS